jgi:hypothetical protein
MLREFPSELTYNSIFVVSSLAEHQKGTTRRIVEDLEVYAARNDIYLELDEPDSVAQFRSVFANIRGKMPPGVGAILHLDMHGSIEKGLNIVASNEFISWAELSRLSAELNLHMRNNLLLLLPVCHGVQLIRHIDMSKNAPFNVFIASKEELDAGFIADTFMPFYKQLTTDGNIISAFNEFLSDKMLLVHSEKIFLVGMARYFRHKCLGKGGQERRETLLTEVLKRTPKNRQSRRSHRARIKDFTKPRPELFERYVTTFLCGRRPSYSFTDVLDFARIP